MNFSTIENEMTDLNC